MTAKNMIAWYTRAREREAITLYHECFTTKSYASLRLPNQT